MNVYKRSLIKLLLTMYLYKVTVFQNYRQYRHIVYDLRY